MRDYQRLKAALDRLQSTTVATSIRETTGRRLRRFPGSTSGRELADASGKPLGIELILPDWFYAGVLDAAPVLTIDPAYFRLTGGIERWLYRLVRKHGGRQEGGWQFDIPAPVSQVWQPGAQLHAILPAIARPGGAAVVARLRAIHRTMARRENGNPGIPTRAANGTGISLGENGTICEWARAIGRAKTRAIRRTGIVLSGARKIASKANGQRGFCALNFNLNISLTNDKTRYWAGG